MPEITFSKIPKPVIYLAILAGGGALIYSYVKKKNEAKTTTATQAQSSAANLYGYGSGSQAYGYGAYTYQPYGYGYGPYGLGSYGGYNGGSYGYGYYGAGVPYQVPTQASTNAQWTQAAVTALSAQGFTGSDVLTALGLYTTGQPVNATQEQIVTAAIGAEGYPPIPGANGYPPAINAGTVNTTGNGTTGTTAPSSAPSGLSATGWTGFADFAWSPVNGATSYNLVIDGNSTSQQGTHAGHVTLAKGKHSWKVQAVNSAGTGPMSATKTVSVK